MSDHCDYAQQSTVNTEDGQLRPDMIVYLPKGVVVPVDAKVPLDACLDAMSATSDEERKRHLRRHAAAVRERMRTLSSKEYANQFPVTPDVTVLFLPSDAFLSAALECDPPLIDDSMQRKVLIATPVSLFSLLKAVHYGWQQETIAKSAKAISDLGKELYDRIETFWSHLDKLRSGLTNAVDCFDAAVGSLEARVFPSVRKFKELGATTDPDIEILQKIGRQSRALPPSAAGSDSSEDNADHKAGS
jgi:DNA recombination protein RmuC